MGHATITFEPSGVVSSVTVDGGAYRGTATGDCVAHVFATVTVPPYDGGQVRIGKAFVLK